MTATGARDGARMVKLIQVGAGSGGMPVLDLVCRDPRISDVLLIEPDIFKPHNVCGTSLPAPEWGRPKVKLDAAWLRERCPHVAVRTLAGDLLDPQSAEQLQQEAAQANMGICAADNEPAKLPGTPSCAAPAYHGHWAKF